MDKLSFFLSNQSIREFLNSYHVGKKKIYDLFLHHSILFEGKAVDYDKKIEGTIEIDLSLIEKVDFPPFDGIIDILYEDNDVLVINKPANIIIHPDSHDGNNTLVNLVSNYYLSKGINRSIRYVHRLDFETSGIILFSKHFLAQAMLDYELQNDMIVRKYYCICQGKTSSGTINKRIGRDRHHNRMIVYDKGIEAITHYKTIKTNGALSLCEVLLETGRTHQIRVHFQGIGHPLLGDILYGEKNDLIKRVALHSHEINFVHPITKKEIHIICKVPKDMEVIINAI